MRNIVVGVDASDGAAEAMRWAVREAQIHGATLSAVLAWGFQDQHHAIVAERLDSTYAQSDALEALHAIITTAVGEDAATTIDARAMCDPPARALLDASSGSDLLVVGARGLGGFRGLLLGSVSQHCLHHTETAIAIVRPRHDERGPGPERIIAAIDGSEPAQRALHWALDEGRARNARVAVLHAWQPPIVGDLPYSASTNDPGTLERSSLSLLEDAIAAHGGDDLPAPIERISLQGGAAAVIIDSARDADLAVMGSRGLGGLKAMLLGSVTTQVTHHAPCTVVVIPPGSRAVRTR